MAYKEGNKKAPMPRKLGALCETDQKSTDVLFIQNHRSNPAVEKSVISKQL
jgi:hypothetical protein